MFSQKLYEQRGAYWPERQYEPKAPHSSGGQDTRGPCIGNFDKKKMCWRDERHPQPAGGPETRIGFQFLTRANSTWELERARSGLGRPPSRLRRQFITRALRTGAAHRSNRLRRACGQFRQPSR